jgi:MFS family permease
VRFASLRPQVDDPAQYALQLAQVIFVGLTLGTMRTVVPAVAESDFGVKRGDIALVASFVFAFGLVKGAMNFVAGAMSERLGRKHVLVIGWMIALPIPVMIWHAPSWGWIVAATALLGVNQGLTWSMTLTSKLDLTRPDQRGLTNGLNEFCGYFAVAVAGILTGYLSDWQGARLGLLIFGFAAIVPALILAMAFVRDTRQAAIDANRDDDSASRDTWNARQVLGRSLRDPAFFAICQCGLFEKFIDVLMWLALPLLLASRGVDLRDIGWAPGAYAGTWGVAQVFTGPMSDRFGRRPMIVGGMMLSALGAAALPLQNHGWWWSACAATAGLGMAMLYPTLGAAVSDLAAASWRGSALGVYRFWRDLGYAVGAATLALATQTGDLAWCFHLVAGCVLASGMAMWMLGSETAPRLSAKSQDQHRQ